VGKQGKSFGGKNFKERGRERPKGFVQKRKMFANRELSSRKTKDKRSHKEFENRARGGEANNGEGEDLFDRTSHGHSVWKTRMGNRFCRGGEVSKPETLREGGRKRIPTGDQWAKRH